MLRSEELTNSYITINTKDGKTKTIEKIIPIIQVEDPNETSVIEYLGELEEAVHLAQDAFSQNPKVEEYSRRKYNRRLKFGVQLELSSGRPNFFYTVSTGGLWSMLFLARKKHRVTRGTLMLKSQNPSSSRLIQ